jgi:hypothetical protein
MGEIVKIATRFIKKKRSLKHWLLLLAALFFFCCCLSSVFNVFLESVGILPTRTPTPIQERSIPTIEIPTETPTRLPTLTDTPQPTATLTPIPPTATLGIPTNTPGAPCSCTGPDLNCTDFYSQRSAQDCFNYCLGTGYGDVFDLDSDKDLQVCESLP